MKDWMRVVASLSFLALAPLCVAATSPCGVGFASSRTFDRGIAPRVAVEVADFDGDGLPDIASLHRFGNDGIPNRAGTILLNRGRLGFDPQPLVVPGDFGTLRAGNLNNDNIPDLVLGGTSALTVLYGNGNGSFRTGATVDVHNVSSIAFGQFDGRNGVDIAVAQSNPPALTILLSNADGTYSAGASYGLNDFGVSVATADFDGDGKSDVVIADKSFVTPYFGNGDGTFTKGTAIANLLPTAVAAGDLDRDGHPDIIVAARSALAVYSYAGARSFRLNGIHSLLNDANAVIVTDVNHDAFPDVVTAGSGEVAVYRGAAGGGLLPQDVYAGGADAEFAAIGDFDGDGFNDVVTANYGSADVSILLNVSAGQLDAMRIIEGDSGTSSIIVKDIDSDGTPDLVIAYEKSKDIAIFKGLPHGGFESPSGAPLPIQPHLMRAGDIDGDANPDLGFLSTDGLTLTFLLGSVTGNFTQSTTLTVGVAISDFVLVDLNGDGKDDLVYGDTGGNVTVRLATGGGSFGSAKVYALAEPATAITAADFDLDSHNDIAVATPTRIFVMYGAPDGSGDLVGATPIEVPDVTLLQAALVDGDVFPDLVAAGKDVAVVYSDHGTSFTNVVHLTLPAGVANGFTVADLNGDGANDIIVTNFDPSTVENFVTIYPARKDGTGGFDVLPAIETDKGPGAVVVTDFDGDHLPDLVIAAGDKTYISRSHCAVAAVTLALPHTISPGQPFTIVANAIYGAVHDAVITFFVDGKIVAAPQSNPLEPGVAPATVTLSAGTHTVSAIVQYAKGGSAASDVLAVTVGGGGGKRHAAKH